MLNMERIQLKFMYVVLVALFKLLKFNTGTLKVRIKISAVMEEINEEYRKMGTGFDILSVEDFKKRRLEILMSKDQENDDLSKEENDELMELIGWYSDLKKTKEADTEDSLKPKEDIILDLQKDDNIVNEEVPHTLIEIAEK